MVWPIFAGLLGGSLGSMLGGAAGGAASGAAGSAMGGGLLGKIMGGASKFGGLMKEGIGATIYKGLDAIPDNIYDDVEGAVKTFENRERRNEAIKGQFEKAAETPGQLPWNTSMPQISQINNNMSVDDFMKLAGGNQQQQFQRTPVNPIVSGYLKGLLGGG